MPAASSGLSGAPGPGERAVGASGPPRFLSVIGTRPEAIKMAPVIRALKRRGGSVHRLVLTGQHADMARRPLRAFAIEADDDLRLMKPGQTLYDIGRACMDGLARVARSFRPDVTIVQGDTATVFFAGLVTFFEQGRLAHVEAGLRSRRKWSPFPEEMLRRMTDTMSDYCFAPTPAAAANLIGEGVEADRVFVTGNTVVDALHEMRAGLRARGAGPGRDAVAGRAHASAEPVTDDPAVAELLVAPGRLVLLTAHRRESFGAPLERVFRAVAELTRRFPDVRVLCPVHPNPMVREPAGRLLGGRDRIHLVEPLSYGDLIAALDRASLVLTDSGGIQEEAPAFGVHTLVLREVTERPEAVSAGAATLVGADPDRILARAAAELAPGRAAPVIRNPYGDGRAGERIADILLAALTGSPRQTSDWAPAAEAATEEPRRPHARVESGRAGDAAEPAASRASVRQ